MEVIDYPETFAPVIRYDSIRNASNIANQYKLQVHQMHITKGRFRYFSLLKTPNGFHSLLNPNIVEKLKKILYGLQ